MFVCVFVCFKGSLPGIGSIFAELPMVLMRHKAIEMVCAHIPQSREPHHTAEVY